MVTCRKTQERDISVANVAVYFPFSKTSCAVDCGEIQPGSLKFPLRYCRRLKYSRHIPCRVVKVVDISKYIVFTFRVKRRCQCQWPRGLRRRSAAARLLRLWGGVDVCCECCVLLGRGLRRADHSSRGVLPTVVRRCV
jgi:hypothetical protein